MPIRDKSSL